MDYIPSMFQFDQSKDHQELCQIISNNFPCKGQHDDDDHNIQIRFEDHHHHHHNHHQAHPPTPSQDGREDLTNKRRRTLSSSNAFGEKDRRDDDGQENPNDKKKKNKVLHREIERQRRTEMAALYASLRSLIPLQHLKGNRSISDQMRVAANYIKELQRKNQELKDKRDRLKKNNSNSCSLSGNTNNYFRRGDREPKRYDSESIIISVAHSRAGIEVALNTAFGEGLSLARLLRVLDQQGLNVVACVSAKVNDRFLHTIESEAVSGKRDLDLAELEQKLKNLICMT